MTITKKFLMANIKILMGVLLEAHSLLATNTGEDSTDFSYISTLMKKIAEFE